MTVTKKSWESVREDEGGNIVTTSQYNADQVWQWGIVLIFVGVITTRYFCFFEIYML